MRIFLVVFMVFMAASQVSAHNVWLERDGQGPVRVYFGHYDSGTVEKTGERLDIIKAETVLPVRDADFPATSAGPYCSDGWSEW